MDIVGVTSVVTNNEGLREKHGLVVVDLPITWRAQPYGNLSGAGDQNAVVGGRLDVHRLDVVAEGSSQTLDHEHSAKAVCTAIFSIMACIPRNSCPSQVSIEQSF